MLRCVLIFPEFDNMQYIDELREQYDPLADNVRPHITLVFPFQSELRKNEFEEGLQSLLQEFVPFSLSLQGLSLSDRWVSLDVVKGASQIKKIHEVLYENMFAPYKPVWLSEYVPHLTVGRLSSAEEAQVAYEQEKAFAEKFYTQINKIFVERIGEDQNSIIELEINL